MFEHIFFEIPLHEVESEVGTLIFRGGDGNPATFEDLSLVRKKMSERLKMDTFKKFFRTL